MKADLLAGEAIEVIQASQLVAYGREGLKISQEVGAEPVRTAVRKDERAGFRNIAGRMVRMKRLRSIGVRLHVARPRHVVKSYEVIIAHHCLAVSV